MPASLSDKESAQPGLPPTEVAAVRRQLDRLLGSSLFANSKRYPVLLAYVVDQTLLGNASQLKERSIGVSAFGRKQDYDANADPVVRTTAAEVRKRLIQYYYEPSHAHELIIELSAGSYIPSFREPCSVPFSDAIVAEQNRIQASIIDQSQLDANAERATESQLVAGSSTLRGSNGLQWFTLAGSLALAALIGYAVGRARPVSNTSDIDAFWRPITAASSITTFCLGEPAKGSALFSSPTAIGGGTEAVSARLHTSGSINLSDVVSLTRTIAPLAAHHGSFRVLTASETSFGQLREGPDVLIGALDNPWTLRLTQQLRFGFTVANGVTQIVDRRIAGQSAWTVPMSVPDGKLSRDYAIVARIHDSITGEPVIIIGGLSDQGTEAASEIVYTPDYLAVLLAKAPKNWSQMNLEAVIGTHVIQGHPGPPDILAFQAW